METASAANAYAIVETGGKQYLVREGSVLSVERLEGPAGGTLTLTQVLAVHDGQRLTIGRPVVAGAQVTCKVVAQHRAPKVVSYKYKRREGFHWKKGHRQELTKLHVLQVTPPLASSPEAMPAGDRGPTTSGGVTHG